MISDYNRLSGLQKVAILFSVLGESLALNLVNDLDKTEIRNCLLYTSDRCRRRG